MHFLNAPVFTAVPPMRCHHRDENLPRGVCGALAAWLRPGSTYRMPGYFCEAHRQATDVAIGMAGAFNRVRVMVDVTFAATSWTAREAKNEAVLALEDAVRRAGGLLNVIQVSSVVGQYASQPPQGGEKSGGDGPE